MGWSLFHFQSSVGGFCESLMEVVVESAEQGFGCSKLCNWLYSPSCFSSGVFEIAEASGVRPGTKIIIHLKSDCKDFASESRVQGEDS
jgi:HSP90 family molecular chaperone